MSPRLSPLPDRFAGTVASLHRVAEELVAPSRKPDNEIALEATPGGFGTPPFEFEGAVHQVRVEGTDLVHAEDGRERRAPLTSLAPAASVVAELLPAGSSPDETPLVIGAAASRALAEWYAFGAEVLGRLGAAAAPEDEAGPAILWPEHFDIAIELGPEAARARATYGFSPGDEEHPQLMDLSMEIMRRNGVTVDCIRAVDHDVATGVWPDMTEHGWERDEWPAIFEQVLAADILVLGMSIWLGEKSSVATRIVERLYGNSHLLNDAGQYAYYGRVGGCLVTGNEDGVKHCAMNVLYSLQHLGYTIPPQADSG